MEIKASLNKAQKLLQKLRGMAPKMYFEASTSFKIDASNFNSPNLLQGIKEKAEKDKETIVRSIDTNEDVTRLKEMIFYKNVSSGVSAKLAAIDTFKNKVKAFKQILDSMNHNDVKLSDVTKEYLDSLSGAVEKGTVRLSVSFVSAEEANEMIYFCQKEINRLEDEVASLNANTYVDIKLSEYSAGLLGLT